MYIYGVSYLWFQFVRIPVKGRPARFFFGPSYGMDYYEEYDHDYFGGYPYDDFYPGYNGYGGGYPYGYSGGMGMGGMGMGMGGMGIGRPGGYW